MTDHSPAAHPPLLALSRTLGACLIGLASAVTTQAQSVSAPTDADRGSVLTPDDLTLRPARWRVSAEQLKLPLHERMTLAGATYQIDIGQGFSLGPGLYGSITGHHGGLAVMGVEAAWRSDIYRKLGVELGVFVGGGGGPGLDVGGGLMVRPHADLLWNFGGARAGLSISKVRFPSGGIDSTQAGFVLLADTDFRFLDGTRIDARRGSPPSGRLGMGFDRILAVGGAMLPRGGTRRISGAPLKKSVGIVGLRMEQALDDHLYWGLEAGGAVRGGFGGYAEYLTTLGWELGFSGGTFAAGARAAVGMGGGGDVDVGGGLLVKAAAYGTMRVAREFGLTLEGGITRAPKGSLTAPYVTLAINWILDDPSDVMAPLRVTRTEWVVGTDRLNAARRDGTTRDLQTITLKANRFVTPNVYVTAQAHTAYAGDAGGYLAGVLGIGARWPFAQRFHVGAELVGGAAGGGGVDNRGGAVFQPSAYVGWDMTPSVALRVGAGRVKSVKGELNTNVFDAGIVYSFGVPGHGYR